MPKNALADAPRASAVRRIVVVDADPALFGLIEAWLAGEGHEVVSSPEGADLVLVDMPFPRQGGLERLRRVGEAHAWAPMIVLSSNFFPGVACCGPVARELGVAGVLAKPLAREALLAAVAAILDRPR